MQRTHKHLYISILLLSACGGGGGSPVSDINQNTAPEITGISDYAIYENSSDVATFQATDAEGDNITYSGS